MSSTEEVVYTCDRCMRVIGLWDNADARGEALSRKYFERYTILEGPEGAETYTEVALLTLLTYLMR